MKYTFTNQLGGSGNLTVNHSGAIIEKRKELYPMDVEVDNPDCCYTCQHWVNFIGTPVMCASGIYPPKHPYRDGIPTSPYDWCLMYKRNPLFKKYKYNTSLVVRLLSKWF